MVERDRLHMSSREFFENLEQYFLKLIMGRQRRSYTDYAMIGVMFFASRFYRMATQFRIWLYDKRIVRNRAIGCLVVSIGNLSCGGTGKTPVVEVFARTLSQKGRRVAILSRGYRSKKRTWREKIRQKFSSEKMEVPPKVVSDGEKLLLDSAYAGDEPYMLARNLKGVVVLVDKDRVKSGLYAIDEFETDTLILDDGFQYLRLKPHINIVLVDTTSPFGNHHVLPRGTLREPVKNIRRADYIFLTKSNGGNQLRHLKSFLRRHNHRAEIIECCHMPQYLEHAFQPDDKLELEHLKNLKVAAISAIANPLSFENFLEGFGAKLTLREHYADHHRYSETEIEIFAHQAKLSGARMIVTTEKDAVRIPASVKTELPIYFLRIKIDILSGQENFDQCISRICFLSD
ncbi:tetraacyldisaccharide 4'-kinase [Victivallis sp. Marseille-Q1083]|uniref:tetraacyldisaccharide 4'-kinase n=1 Tax=Victivallis sp. Marseille-Q1083 TaxID=2717288 RepID=UPI001C377566|nr:tetraacyldisaccharide 4'-kinase [Victivallis sp. Marseille-Q1083]